MPTIGWFEILIVVGIAIVVLGPKDFPIVLKKIGNFIGSAKRYFSDIQQKVEKLDEDIDENSIEDKYSNKNNCAYVPQNISIPEGMSLIEYVLLGRNSYTNWFLSEDKKDYEIVEKALNKLNLQTKKNQMVKTLSGGEMQRATLSRALAQEANLLLLDEPTSSLDFAKTNEFYDLIIQLKKDLKLTIFFSTHDINSISKYSEYVIVLKKGKKIFSGKINEILNEVFLSELYETKLNKIITEDGYPLFY